MARTFAARRWRGLVAVAPIGALLALAPPVATGQLPSVQVHSPVQVHVPVHVPDVPNLPGPTSHVTGPVVNQVNNTKNQVLGQTSSSVPPPGNGGGGGGGDNGGSGQHHQRGGANTDGGSAGGRG